MKSSKPNIQNIPIRTEIGKELRKAFTKDRVFIEADYSELEMRIAAQVMAEEPMGDNNSHGDQITTERGRCLVCEGPTPKPGRVHIVYGSETHQNGEHFTCIPKEKYNELMQCELCEGRKSLLGHPCLACKGLGRRF